MLASPEIISAAELIGSSRLNTEIVVFPNAGGPLRDEMAYAVGVDRLIDGMLCRLGPEELQQQHESALTSLPHLLISRAIHRLDSRVGWAARPGGLQHESL